MGYSFCEICGSLLKPYDEKCPMCGSDIKMRRPGAGVSGSSLNQFSGQGWNSGQPGWGGSNANTASMPSSASDNYQNHSERIQNLLQFLQNESDPNPQIPNYQNLSGQSGKALDDTQSVYQMNPQMKQETVPPGTDKAAVSRNKGTNAEWFSYGKTDERAVAERMEFSGGTPADTSPDIAPVSSEPITEPETSLSEGLIFGTDSMTDPGPTSKRQSDPGPAPGPEPKQTRRPDSGFGSNAKPKQTRRPDPGLAPGPGVRQESRPDSGFMSGPGVRQESRPDSGFISGPGGRQESRPDPGLMTGTGVRQESRPDPGLMPGPGARQGSRPDSGFMTGNGPGAGSQPDSGLSSTASTGLQWAQNPAPAPDSVSDIRQTPPQEQMAADNGKDSDIQGTDSATQWGILSSAAETSSNAEALTDSGLSVAAGSGAGAESLPVSDQSTAAVDTAPSHQQVTAQAETMNSMPDSSGQQGYGSLSASKSEVTTDQDVWNRWMENNIRLMQDLPQKKRKKRRFLFG